jgi:prolyl-tRNA synthetase
VMEMGTYGIGVTRTMAAAVEQNHDDKGILWPVSIAPFEVIVVPVKNDDHASSEAATRLHDELEASGIDVILDDRDERAGVKFNDADLLGIPMRVTIGPRGLANGMIEIKARSASAAEEIPIAGGAAEIASRIRAARAELMA